MRWWGGERSFDRLGANGRVPLLLAPKPSPPHGKPSPFVVSLSNHARDRAEIADLMARYLFAMDYHDVDAYAECFAEDGVLDYAMGRLQGREAIRVEARAFAGKIAEIFKDWQGIPAKLRHLVHQKALRVDGDRAWHTGLWWEMTNGGPQGSVATPSFGTYEDELVRIDGCWLFKRRKIYNEFLPERESGPGNPVTAMAR